MLTTLKSDLVCVKRICAGLILQYERRSTATGAALVENPPDFTNSILLSNNPAASSVFPWVCPVGIDQT